MNDNSHLTKESLLDFLDSQATCTISTIGEEGYPNAATVAFSNSPELKFVIGTSIESRKAGNIEKNNKVALTVTDTEKRWTVQLEGDIRELPWDEFETKYSEGHYKKLPFSLPFKDLPDQTNYEITPVHLRLSDVSVKPWQTKDF